MGNILFESGWLAAPSAGNSVNVVHNLGKMPKIIMLTKRMSDGAGGYLEDVPTTSDEIELEGTLQLKNFKDFTEISVYCHELYDSAGLEFFITITD